MKALKVISTNIGRSTQVTYLGKEIETGIFKYPVQIPLKLMYEDVMNDIVVDRKVHGGFNKACYLFSTDHYEHWKTLYPQLKWDWGMFGENLSIENMDEQNIRVGDVFQLGTAIVQAVQPRQPCFKLGLRFGNQAILKQFIQTTYSGIYLKLLEPGEVSVGTVMNMLARGPGLTIADVFKLLYSGEISQSKLELALSSEVLPDSCKKDISRRIKS